MGGAIAAVVILGLCGGSRADDLTFTRERSDEMAEATLNATDLSEAEGNDLAWGMGYVLNGYMELYEATGDRDYLRKGVALADQMLAVRDDKLGREDFAGRSLPVWGVGAQFTVASATLKDVDGRDAVLLRSIRYAYNDQTVVTVETGSEPGTWKLSHVNEQWKERATQSFDNLSLDPDSPRYIETVIAQVEYHPDIDFERDLEETPSFLLIALDLRPDATDKTLAPVDDLRLAPQRVAYGGYIGPICAPMMRLAAVVMKDRALREEFGEAAKRYSDACEESFAYWQDSWRNGPGKGEGYYLLVAKGDPFWCDGVGAPLNYLCAAGQALIHLYDATGKAKYRRKAARIARLLKSQLELSEDDTYTWTYWWGAAETGWTKEDDLSVYTPAYPGGKYIEDISHGAWDVEHALLMYEHGLVFTREDMERFANTFTENIIMPGEDRVADRVDGSTYTEGTNNIAGGRWMELSEFDPAIFTTMRDIFEANGYHKGAYGHLAEVYARLYKWQERLAGEDGGSQ